MKKVRLFLMMLMVAMLPLAMQAQQTLPYEYGFEDNDLAAAGWTMSNCNSSTGINSSAKMNGDYGFRFYYTTNYPQYLISPEIADAATGVEVSFYYKAYNSYYTESFQVGYSTTDADPASFTWGEEVTTQSTSTTWTLYNTVCPAGTKYVAIACTSDDQFYLFLDDFSFIVPPTCPKPTGLAYSNVTAHTADLNWTAGGTETEWTIDANGTLTTGVTTNPYTLTGLTAGTEYTVKVKANCTDEDASDWSATVSFTTPPTCLVPTALAVTEGSITTTSAEISWTDNNETDPANGWTIDVNGTEVAAATNPFTLTLNPSTSYTVKVKANCSDEDASAWSSTISFATECDAITDMPWLNDFEDFAENTVPVCWDNSESTSSTVTNNPERIWGVYSNNNNKMLRMYNYFVQTGAALINSPAITLPTEDVYALSFKYSHLANCGAFTVKISNDGGNTFVEKGSFSATSTSYNYTNPGTFTSVLPISLAEYAGETIIVQFYADATYGNGAIFIDDVNIDLAPTCFEPSALHLDTVTATTATLSWTDNNETAPEGWTISFVAGENEIVVPASDNPTTVENLDPETTYVVKVKANCDASSESTWSPSINVTTTPSCLAPTNLTYSNLQSTSVTLSWTANNDETQWIVVLNNEEILVEENPVTISTLTAETDYTVNVRSLCSVEDTSHNSNTVAFYTGLCIPAPTSVDGSGITNVTFGQTEVVNNTTHPTSQPYYGNYTDQIGDAAAGTSVTVDVTYATGYTYGTVIWVNWNNDVEFTDNEVVFAGTSTNTNPTTLSCTFTIPANTPVGTYKMRIGGADSQFDNAITNGSNYNPCLNSYYTIYEDYTLSVTEAPACVAPTLNPATDVTANTATISWTANSGETEWTIEVNGEETTGITENPYTIENLNPASTYSVRIKANCSDEEMSEYSSAITFNTPCVIVEVTAENPFIEDFNTLTEGIPACWDNSDGTTTSESYKWNYYATGATGACVRFDSYLNSTGNTNMLKTPVLDVTALEMPYLSFNCKNPTGGDFSVFVSTDGGNTYTTALATALTDIADWNSMGIAMTNLEATNNVVIVFQGTSNWAPYGTDGYLYLDDVRVGEAPSCLQPTSVEVDNITNTSATISWTDNNVEAPQGWTIEVNGTEVAASTNPFTLDNLTAATIYTVKVKANCTDDDESDWSTVVSFATECDEVIVVTNENPYQEGFENGGVCWSIEQIAGGYDWWIEEDEDYAYEGSFVAIAPYQPGSQTRLISPVYDLTQLSNATLTFYHKQAAYQGNIDAMAVYYRTSASDEWTLLVEYTTEVAEYTMETIDLTNLSATYQISFVSTGYDGYNVFLDDINIFASEETPCATPANVTVENGVVTWTGDAANYNVVITVEGDTAVNTTVSTNSYTIEGLEEGVHAIVTVQAVCSEDNLSEWSEAVEFDYTVGVNNYSIKANIYPNPTTGNVTVESNAINADINVYDMFGKLMMTSKVAADRTELDFSGFAPGVYMVRIANTTGTTNIKVVKE